VEFDLIPEDGSLGIIYRVFHASFKLIELAISDPPIYGIIEDSGGTEWSSYLQGMGGSYWWGFLRALL
jgi:hypothetical protein